MQAMASRLNRRGWLLIPFAFLCFSYVKQPNYRQHAIHHNSIQPITYGLILLPVFYSRKIKNLKRE